MPTLNPRSRRLSASARACALDHISRFVPFGRATLDTELAMMHLLCSNFRGILTALEHASDPILRRAARLAAHDPNCQSDTRDALLTIARHQEIC